MGLLIFNFKNLKNPLRNVNPKKAKCIVKSQKTR